MAITLTARRLITANEVIAHPLITIEDGFNAAIAAREEQATTAATYCFEDGTLTAGLLDIHLHGAMGHDVMEGTPEAMSAVATFLARHGVTEFLPTTVTASLEHTLRALDGIAAAIEKRPAEGEAKPVGIHIEGPFVSHAKRGMHPEEFIVAPTPELLNKFWEAARGHIKLMTIAPEVPGAVETIARATALGIRSSVGHSNATRAETMRALEAGATSATHTYNAMRPLDHREPGILGTVLDCSELYAELICDGVHVAPETVRLWFKAKGPERAILITDALEAAGMPDGVYKLGQTTVHVREGRCTTDAGVLAGSVITLDQAVTRFREVSGADLSTAVQMASRNPARMLGLPEQVAAGSAANFNVYDADGRRTHTMLRGKLS